ncbi:uncharacterized protein EDB91DRAFT_1085633 [Suillus paluster]|uniref:uncharacterized protein n=1 Tax=Suillus paluster TaxID=48578 RepID=UPI001B865408|nr:uncharacterized protein EDB91DRAFT_1085633 [Suillus paluster]KAG1729855.1 hypothetical protein EDB91DRAFT_1085633 [Suillus paluster]
MSNSSASSATIVAVAVLENGRFCEGQGRALNFDAQIYLGDDCPPLLAALKYFNADNQAFDPVGFYIVIARVAKMEPSANINLDDRNRESYFDLVGDVVRLIPIAKDGVSPLYTPYIEICGTIEHVDDLANTFSIDVHQYVSSLRTNSTGASSTSQWPFKSILPVECGFPNTARWTKSGKKLTPQLHHYISVTGFITGRKVKTVEGSEPETDRFTVEVDSIVFLGRPVVTKSSGSISAITEIRSFYKWNTEQTWVEIRLLSSPPAC